MSGRSSQDIVCLVCGDLSSGKHYGVYACDGCAGFFKRSVRKNRRYVCNSRIPGTCKVDRQHRNQCRACRLRKCVDMGMNRQAVQNERGPRPATVHRQMALLLDDVPQIVTPFPLFPYKLFVPVHQNPEVVPMSCTAIPPFRLSAVQNMSETAASLLLMNLRWMKSVLSVRSLTKADQTTLLQAGWRELFVLGLAQIHFPLDAASLLSQIGTEMFKEEITRLKKVVESLQSVCPDPTEYCCLKTIALFNTVILSHSEGTPLQDLSSVASLQDQAQLTLSKYIQTSYPSQPLRFGRLLILLPALKSVSTTLLEELFFRKTVGAVSVCKILTDLYDKIDPDTF